MTILFKHHSLGHPLPDDPHSVSVSMPLWSDVVGYEEGNPSIVNQLQTGYPRFFIHPFVQKLNNLCETQFAREGEACFIFPSEKVAKRCAAFITRQSRKNSELRFVSYFDLCALFLPKDLTTFAKNYWQHSGEIVSSRHAEAILNSQNPLAVKQNIHTELRLKLSQLSGIPASDIFLFPSGMSAIRSAYELVLEVGQKLRPNSKGVQFGFPYIDTLKLQERLGTGAIFFPHGGEHDLKKLLEHTESGQVSHVFTEFPCNPLLQSPSLSQLSKILHPRDIPLVVDDTIGTCHNVDVTSWADIIVTSLTKFTSGVGNVAAGALFLNPRSKYYQQFHTSLTNSFEELLYYKDAAVILKNCQDFNQRMTTINHTCEQLVDFLYRHPKIEHLYYPKYTDQNNYHEACKNGAGYSGLFSIVLKNPATTSAAFYDQLEVSKGPGLGTNFTLVCPYTLLAHYNELDWAESCGVSHYLIRTSVGLEDSKDLIYRFEKALKVGNN